MATRRWLGVSPIYKEHTLIPLIYGQGMHICSVQLRIYKGGIREVVAPYSTPGGSGRSRGGTAHAGICRKGCKKAMEPVIQTVYRGYGVGGDWKLAIGSRTAVQEVQVGQKNKRQPFPDPECTAMHRLSPQVNRWRQPLCGVGYRRGVGSRKSAIHHIPVHIQLGVVRGKASRVCGPRGARERPQVTGLLDRERGECQVEQVGDEVGGAPTGSMA